MAIRDDDDDKKKDPDVSEEALGDVLEAEPEDDEVEEAAVEEERAWE